MKEEIKVKKVHAPYNFVPFSNKVIERYKQEEELPGHGKIYSELKSGEIRVTFTADSPVYVSNGKGREEDNGNKADFFRGANGKYQIPGSAVRGMIRENMQILGLGLVSPKEDVDDYQIYFRNIASAKESVGNQVKEYYKTVLDVQTEKAGNKTFSVPRKVKSGYLYCENNVYYIRPTSKKVLKVSRNNPGIAGIDFARTYQVACMGTGEIVKQIEILNGRRPKPGWKTGILLSTGRWVGKKNQNHLYVFLDADMEEDKKEIIKPEDIISYQEDLESRKNSLRGSGYNPEFWSLPEEGENKPVFYVANNGHLYFGMSLFLRIGYGKTISKGLPESHRKRSEGEKQFLDYPHAVMGYADERGSYRSRVSVGNFELVGKGKKMEPYHTILGEPKAGYYPGYLKKEDTYVSENFQLRGYKQYWMKELDQPQPYKEGKVQTTLHPLAAGSKFQGIIRFKNLQEDELGLLLWSLILEEGCYQSIGMGRPCGFGRMKVEIDDLREVNLDNMYQLSGLCQELPSAKDKIETYIKAYESYMSKRLAEEKQNNTGKQKKKKAEDQIRHLPEVEDFFFIRRMTTLSREETSYMSLEEYQNTQECLPVLRDIRKDVEEKKEEPPRETKMVGGLDFSKFNGCVR